MKEVLEKELVINDLLNFNVNTIEDYLKTNYKDCIKYLRKFLEEDDSYIMFHIKDKIGLLFNKVKERIDSNDVTEDEAIIFKVLYQAITFDEKNIKMGKFIANKYINSNLLHASKHLIDYKEFHNNNLGSLIKIYSIKDKMASGLDYTDEFNINGDDSLNLLYSVSYYLSLDRDFIKDIKEPITEFINSTTKDKFRSIFDYSYFKSYSNGLLKNFKKNEKETNKKLTKNFNNND